MALVCNNCKQVVTEKVDPATGMPIAVWVCENCGEENHSQPQQAAPAPAFTPAAPPTPPAYMAPAPAPVTPEPVVSAPPIIPVVPDISAAPVPPVPPSQTIPS